MATFTDLPDATYTQTIRYNTLKTNTMYGKERRRNKWSTPKRTFVLNFNNITRTVKDSIDSFFTTHKNFQSFDWTNPQDDVAYTVRFVESFLKSECIGEDNYNIQLNFVEVL